MTVTPTFRNRVSLIQPTMTSIYDPILRRSPLEQPREYQWENSTLTARREPSPEE